MRSQEAIWDRIHELEWLADSAKDRFVERGLESDRREWEVARGRLHALVWVVEG